MCLVYHTVTAVYNHMLHRLSQLSAGTHGCLLCAPKSSVVSPTRAVAQRTQRVYLHSVGLIELDDQHKVKNVKPQVGMDCQKLSRNGL